MGKLRVDGFSLSLDGYGAGPRQDLDNPLGVRGEQLHGWLVAGLVAHWIIRLFTGSGR